MAASEAEWTADGLTYREHIVQPYPNMRISAGLIVAGAEPGHERNSVYLRFEADDGRETFVCLTDDEMAAVAWVASGVLWSRLIEKAHRG